MREGKKKHTYELFFDKRDNIFKSRSVLLQVAVGCFDRSLKACIFGLQRRNQGLILFFLFKLDMKFVLKLAYPIVVLIQ